MKTRIVYHKTLLFRWRIFFILSFLLCEFSQLRAIEVERFEKLNTEDGLSQNSVVSIFCDHKGFMWLGTWDGLNRYDGYNFRILKAQSGKSDVLTNNRIIKIWEDQRNFLWVDTYDGYTHWFNPETEKFKTIPFFYRSEEEKNSSITCFQQFKQDEIWIGSSNSGLYYLQYDSLSRDYIVNQYLSRGISALTNNEVRFIVQDTDFNIWIGTHKGLNKLENKKKNIENQQLQHYYINLDFTVAAASKKSIWFGTKSHGIILFDNTTNTFNPLPKAFKTLNNSEITLLYTTTSGNIVIGTAQQGLYIYNTLTKTLRQYILTGNRINTVYEDAYGLLWITTEKFGITKLDPANQKSHYFILTPKEIEPLVDEERQYIFEDSQKNLWIGLHGAGLAHYVRENDNFEFFRNDPNDPSTISSNFVHCITEDQSGLLWVGTGQVNGGINKIIPANPSFKQIIPKKNITDMADNVVRCIFEDDNGYIWMATKSGRIYIYDKNFNLKTTLHNLPLIDRNLPGYNIYSITQDSKGYIWLGSKGGGIAVSTLPLSDLKKNYNLLNFRLYQHHPKISSSLSSNYVYSITEDHEGKIWIGTYGGGLNLVEHRTNDSIFCKHYNRANSNLTSDDIRHVFEDSRHRLWIATVFGLNLLDEVFPENDSISFRSFNYNPLEDSTISYNDIIHIFEDTDQNIWFATFGGGVNRLASLTRDIARFENFNHTQGLINDAVCGILQDDNGNLWFSTENGISMLDIKNRKFENYDKNNGLLSSKFCENTCIHYHTGELIFGSTQGTLVVYPDKISKKQYIPPIVLSNFQLFNQDVDIHDKDAPFHKTIEYLDKIVLKHSQSSFTIEYAALSYFDPKKTQYAYILENFENRWNEVSSLRRATYTNLSPGRYIFKVKAANWDGTWNENPRVLHITILPPWWRTIWAYIIYSILFLILGEITRRILTKYNHMRNDLRVERRVNEIKLQFFTNISHEIRTPLTLILGPLEDMKAHEKLNASLKRSIDIMDRNGKRMLRLVNQLLDFRKIQKNKMKLKVRKFEAIGFVKEVCENFNPMAIQKSIKFNFSSSIKEQDVWADPDKFDSVLFNILSNAFKFIKSNREINVNIEKENEDFLKILVRDQGPGIPKDKLPVLFQRFTPLSGTDVNYSGTGIGLALSNEIMKLHKGEIRVESELGAGSTFMVLLKLGNKHFSTEELQAGETVINTPRHEIVEEEDKNTSQHRETDENGEPEKHKNSVLVVEDNEEITNYILEILDHQFEIITALNGKEGLIQVQKHHPDLILTDLMMPEMDGIEMTKQIKNNFETSHIPVIMLTAKSQIKDQIEGIESGAEAYILKPFNTNYLKAVVANILKQRDIIIKKFRDKKDVENSEFKITTRDEEFLKNIVSIIEENFSDPDFNVEKLIEKSYVGRTVLYNKIKGLTGLSPVEFIRQMRLKTAADLLVTSGYNVSEIAYMTGFNDIKYFSKCFKALFNTPPSEYKNLQVKNHL
ncbi:MAG: response regulator [Bacteroidales bacterium]|nr:response regulator [Bacteroidales bacterium]